MYKRDDKRERSVGKTFWNFFCKIINFLLKCCYNLTFFWDLSNTCRFHGRKGLSSFVSRSDLIRICDFSKCVSFWHDNNNSSRVFQILSRNELQTAKTRTSSTRHLHDPTILLVLHVYDFFVKWEYENAPLLRVNNMLFTLAISIETIEISIYYYCILWVDFNGNERFQTNRTTYRFSMETGCCSEIS